MSDETQRNDDSLTAEPDLAPSPEPAEDNRVRWIVWLGALVLFAGFSVLPRISTNLGVEAPSSDKSGHDHVWRIWWRARHEIVDFGPAWGFTIIYLALALAFVALSALVVWIALVPDERTGGVSDPTATP